MASINSRHTRLTPDDADAAAAAAADAAAAVPFCRSHLRTAGINFYINERQLHGGGSDPAASQPCPQLFSLMALRHPQQHMTEMLLQVQHDTQVGALLPEAPP
jgi:hypothetical protein